MPPLQCTAQTCHAGSNLPTLQSDTTRDSLQAMPTSLSPALQPLARPPVSTQPLLAVQPAWRTDEAAAEPSGRHGKRCCDPSCSSFQSPRLRGQSGIKSFQRAYGMRCIASAGIVGATELSLLCGLQCVQAWGTVPPPLSRACCIAGMARGALTARLAALGINP